MEKTSNQTQTHVNIGAYKEGYRLKGNSPSPLLKGWLPLKHLKEITYFVLSNFLLLEAWNGSENKWQALYLMLSSIFQRFHPCVLSEENH